MKLRKTILLLTFFSLLLGVAFPIPALDPLILAITVKGLTEAEPPRRLGDQLLFTYKPDYQVRHVGIRFQHENFARLHTYVRNEQGVFFYLYDIPENEERIVYRIVVDGLWISDPANPNRFQDESGLFFSVVHLEGMPEPAIENPRIEADGSVTFSFKTLSGRAVSISGDWNHWDPYMHRLTEIRPGLYRITLDMLPGRHFYIFILGGERILDPYNQQTAVDPEGFRVSTFTLPAMPKTDALYHW